MGVCCSSEREKNDLDKEDIAKQISEFRNAIKPNLPTLNQA